MRIRTSWSCAIKPIFTRNIRMNVKAFISKLAFREILTLKNKLKNDKNDKNNKIYLKEKKNYSFSRMSVIAIIFFTIWPISATDFLLIYE